VELMDNTSVAGCDYQPTTESPLPTVARDLYRFAKVTPVAYPKEFKKYFRRTVTDNYGDLLNNVSERLSRVKGFDETSTI
jgi:hypothetical protein